MWKYNLALPCVNIKPGDIITTYDNFKYIYISDGNAISPNHPYCAVRITVMTKYTGSRIDYTYDSPPILFREFPCKGCKFQVKDNIDVEI